jgi:pimeloyl-ACP methyl ester carboxylesterase
MAGPLVGHHPAWEPGPRRRDGHFALASPPAASIAWRWSWLLGGERSPAHLAKSLDALAAVMPDAVRVTLPRRDHFAHRKAPAEVARVIEDLARQVLH